MKARLRKLAALLTRRRIAGFVFLFAVGNCLFASLVDVAIGRYADAAVESVAAALVILGSWMFERGAVWVDAKAARAEAERDVAQLMVAEADRYRDRLAIVTLQTPKAPPSSRN